MKIKSGIVFMIGAQQLKKSPKRQRKEIEKIQMVWFGSLDFGFVSVRIWYRNWIKIVNNKNIKIIIHSEGHRLLLLNIFCVCCFFYFIFSIAYVWIETNLCESCTHPLISHHLFFFFKCQHRARHTLTHTTSLSEMNAAFRRHKNRLKEAAASEIPPPSPLRAMGIPIAV